MLKTQFPVLSPNDRRWYLFDAKDKVLGRFASEITYLLCGKGKRTYSPHTDSGDYVVVINAEAIKIKGNSKPEQKIDFRHSGYPGGDTMTPYKIFLKDKPERAIELAVKGMLPKNKLRQIQLERLKVYKGSSHPHGANLAGSNKSEANKGESKS